MITERFNQSAMQNSHAGFMEAIKFTMVNHGLVDWESIELISTDDPILGDVTYEFKLHDSDDSYQIMFKRPTHGNRNYFCELYKQSKEKLKLIDKSAINIKTLSRYCEH